MQANSEAQEQISVEALLPLSKPAKDIIRMANSLVMSKLEKDGEKVLDIKVTPNYESVNKRVSQGEEPGLIANDIAENVLSVMAAENTPPNTEGNGFF